MGTVPVLSLVVHQGAVEDFRLIDFSRTARKVKKGRAVGIRGKERLAGVAAAGDVVVGVFELDPKGPGHGGRVAEKALFSSIDGIQLHSPVLHRVPTACDHLFRSKCVGAA